MKIVWNRRSPLGYSVSNRPGSTRMFINFDIHYYTCSFHAGKITILSSDMKEQFLKKIVFL